jgi:hypothetical protein
MLTLGDFDLGEVLLSMLWFFMLVIWFWLLITVFADLFRDHEASGWAKALWVIFVILFPFLGILVYLIARGKGMQERTVKEAQVADAAFRQYVQQTAGSSGSTADELQKLASLREKGVLSDAEFEAQKARLLA